MNGDKIFQILSDLDDRFVEEAIRSAPGEASGRPERIVRAGGRLSHRLVGERLRL